MIITSLCPVTHSETIDRKEKCKDLFYVNMTLSLDWTCLITFNTRRSILFDESIIFSLYVCVYVSMFPVFPVR